MQVPSHSSFVPCTRHAVLYRLRLVVVLGSPLRHTPPWWGWTCPLASQGWPCLLASQGWLGHPPAPGPAGHSLRPVLHPNPNSQACTRAQEGQGYRMPGKWEAIGSKMGGEGMKRGEGMKVAGWEARALREHRCVSLLGCYVAVVQLSQASEFVNHVLQTGGNITPTQIRSAHGHNTLRRAGREPGDKKGM